MLRTRLGSVFSIFVPLFVETDFTTASQLKKRLIAENFLSTKTSANPSAGILESEKRSKSQKKKPSKATMTVNHSYEQKKIKDAVYFTPGNEIETKLLAGFTSRSKKDNNNKVSRATYSGVIIVVDRKIGCAGLKSD